MYLHHTTALIPSFSLEEQLGKSVLLKLENTQTSGSFKIRGIGLLAQHAQSEGFSHLVSSSGGNAGYATAYAARALQMKATIFVPIGTHSLTVEKLQALGATVHIQGEVWDQTHRMAQTYCQQIGGFYTHPFDHPILWTGHSTVIDELIQQTDKPDAIVVAVGGGGLLSGIAEGLHRNNWQDVSLIAAETQGANSFELSQNAGILTALDRIDTIASSLGALSVCEKALEWSKAHRIVSAVVTDQQAANACVRFLEEQRFMVEPACGAALAVAYENLDVLKEMNKIVVIICGGINVELQQINHWKNSCYVKP